VIYPSIQCNISTAGELHQHYICICTRKWETKDFRVHVGTQYLYSLWM